MSRTYRNRRTYHDYVASLGTAYISPDLAIVGSGTDFSTNELSSGPLNPIGLGYGVTLFVGHSGTIPLLLQIHSVSG